MFFDIDFCIDFLSTFWSKFDQQCFPKTLGGTPLFAPEIDPGAQSDSWMHYYRLLANFWRPLASLWLVFAHFRFLFDCIWFPFVSFLVPFGTHEVPFGYILAPSRIECFITSYNLTISSISYLATLRWNPHPCKSLSATTCGTLP